MYVIYAPFIFIYVCFFCRLIILSLSVIYLEYDVSNKPIELLYFYKIGYLSILVGKCRRTLYAVLFVLLYFFFFIWRAVTTTTSVVLLLLLFVVFKIKITNIDVDMAAVLIHFEWCNVRWIVFDFNFLLFSVLFYSLCHCGAGNMYNFHAGKHFRYVTTSQYSLLAVCKIR